MVCEDENRRRGPRGTARERSITPARMGIYLAAAQGDGDRVRALYLWDRELAAAFFADLAILEVALRTAMSARLKGWMGL
ncbi:hypothetical protein [Corynebacterium sp. CCM 9204]|uniref:hypothetical protein n=1 Tax=Corynebacterium sp. CCM 9204 TaxID=3057616 RepID=UPI0035267EC9